MTLSVDPLSTTLSNKHLLDSLSNPQRQLLKQHLAQHGSEYSLFPLSFAQQRLWFLDQLDPDSIHYNIPLVLRLVGQLDVSQFNKAINQLIQRHEVLRTTFLTVVDTPYQQVHPAKPFALPVIDLTEESDIQVQARQEADQLINRPFSLQEGPLFRLSLLKLSQNEHLLVFVAHHIISDGWSTGVFVGELSQLYAEQRPLPPLTIQYGDYATWQRNWLQGETLEAQLDYWRNQMAGAPPLLELPTDFPRPTFQTYQGASISFTLDPDISQQWRDLCQQEDTTLFMGLLALFKVLLYHYSGQDDISVGTPMAGRQDQALESLIGFFVNTVVLRTQLSGQISFRTLLQQVRQQVLDGYAHQDLPFEKLVDALQVKRSLSYSPLFQVLFALQNVPMSGQPAPDLTLKPFEIDTQTAQFDLSLMMLDEAEGISGTFIYNTALFTAPTMQKMVTHFEALLTAVLHTPESPLLQLPMLTEAELAQQNAWNETAVAYPQQTQFLHHQLIAQAQKTPSAIAVRFGKHTLTYQQLDETTNQLAHHLQTLGVTPDTLVGICMERSLQMVQSIWAILKAGGAYLPLDPTYPDDRLHYMLTDAQPTIVLTHEETLGQKLADFFPETEPPFALLNLQHEQPALAQQPTTPPATSVTLDNIAYVIYTSGSTGKPKGAMNSHRAIINRILWMQAEYQLNGSDRVMQKTPFSFDVSVWEFLWPLTVGAQLVVAKPEGHKDSAYLLDLIEQQQITTMHFVPSMLQLFVEEPQLSERAGSLRRVICSGEALPYPLQERFMAQLSAELHNLYGPTEAAIDVTYWQCHPTPDRPVVPIGRPIANLQMLLLNPALEPVPVGVAGELYIGGVGLARGYHKRPSLTATRFVPHPTQEGERLYRTGDLARYRPDGAIEFLGRVDNQIKLRGFRIELGEIEAVLAQQEQVREAVVIVHTNAQQDKQLVAYLAPETVSEEAVRTFASQQLPEYMVPAIFMPLSVLPLLPNGKVNRKALPEPTITIQQDSYQPPSTPTQELLVQIWQEVLALEKVGIHDNFFLIGGHSLLATRVISRIRTSFEVALPLRDLFTHATIAELAPVIEKARSEQAGQTAPPLTPQSRPEQIPLSFAQQRLWFLDSLEPNSNAYNMPIALTIQGELNMAHLTDALNHVVARHESLRTAFGQQDGVPYQYVVEEASVQLELIDAQDWEETAVEQHAFTTASKPFQLDHAPLMRVTVWQTAVDQHLFLLTMHHIISDGWSLDILIREIMACYAIYQRAEEPTLPMLPIQYPDFAIWQRGWLQGDVLEAQIGYWRTQLGGTLPILNLPTDYPRPAMQTYAGAIYTRLVPSTIAHGVQALSQQANATLFMTWLACFKLLLSRYANQDDVLVGTPIANRTRQEVEGLIGFFVNTLVLRSDLSGNPDFMTLLAQVRQTALEAYEHQDVPFEQLVDTLQPTRDMSHSPIFQAMFTLNNEAQQQAQSILPSNDTLTLSPVDLPNQVAKFDLTLTVDVTSEATYLSIEYNTDLFSPDTITRMTDHFEALLTSILATPQQPIHRLNMLTPTEEAKLNEWNETAVTLPPTTTHLHHGLMAQAQKTPSAIAVCFGEQTLTYQQLDEQSNQLAHYLQEQGVRTETPVALCVPRSLEMIVGLYAILKAGGTYLPIDPTYPAERIQWMLEDSQATLLLTHSTLDLPDISLTTLALDTAWNTQLANYATQAPPEQAQPNSLAYIIYTSGSTGTPKGVGIPHRQIAEHTEAMRQQYAITSQDKMLLFASFSFDASLDQLLPFHIAGASVVIRDEEIWDAYQLKTKIDQYQINIIDLAPAYWQMLIQAWAQDQSLIPAVRLIVVGGDALLPSTLDLRQQLALSGQLFNAYGPTETTITSSLFDVDSHQKPLLRVPIGKPMPNTRYHILDSAGNRCPVGIAGELHIGGARIARGYLNRPSKTAEQFIPDPFSQETGARLYRTGDLARYLPDGNVAFLGRIDNQVKLRGFRIELGEIEATLAEYDVVTETAVTIHNDQLIAYVVTTATTEALQTFIASRLPSYMVPSQFILLEAMPLLTSGKIDRNSLPKPETASSDSYQPPSTPTQELLVQIWQEVLALDKIGIQDNFFLIGGHSLLATQVTSRLRTRFNVELPLRDLFTYDTIATLAPVIEQTRAEQAGQIAPPLIPQDRPNAIPLSFAQQRLWFLDQIDPNTATYNIPLIIQLRGEFDSALFEQALNQLIVRHETLRTSFKQSDGVPSQQIEPAITLTMPLFEAQEWSEAQLYEAVLQEANTPFDLTQAPLMRGKLWQRANDLHVLVFTMHHIISDGWSIQILMQELVATYTALLHDKSPALPTLPIQYADFAIWQRDSLTGDALETQIAYWRNKLAGELPIMNLPIDYTRPPVQTYEGTTYSYELPLKLSKALREQSQASGTTLFMTLLAGFKLLLAYYTNQDDILVGTPVANRNRQEVEGLIGFFVNTLVLRTDLSGAITFDTLLQRVRATALEAYDHQDVPFEKLVDEVQPERDMSRTPLFQVMFTLVDAQQTGITSNETNQMLTLEPVDVESTIAKFDLTLLADASQDKIGLTLEYNTDLFAEPTMQRLLTHLQQVFTAVTQHPQRPLNQLAILTAEEVAQLNHWNQTAVPLPTPYFHEWVAQQDGAQTAVVHGNHSLTYAQLNQQANQLAHYLQAQGIGTDDIVGLCLNRSVEMIVSLLAVFKAGAAYLPLDPNYPQDRLQFMIEDAQLSHIITQTAQTERLSEQRATLINLDNLAEQLALLPVVPPTTHLHLDNLAYIIYTSGSTGRPKGVAISHRGLQNLAQSQLEHLEIHPESHVLQFSSLNFDASIFDIVLALRSGATLYLGEPEQVDKLLQEHHISHALIPPSVVATLPDTTYPHLKHLIVGGEACPPNLVEKWATPERTFYNAYGPTESTVWATMTPLKADGNPPPIGQAVTNTQLHVLDQQMRPLPVGVAGELYIGSTSLARGYLHRPSLTAVRFVPNPFDPNSRLYRTGDLVRYRADGQLEFLGRIDHQIKLRGFRIELGEIETAISQIAGVQETAVLLRHDPPQPKQLVAYVVASETTISTIQTELAERLPEYMLPSIIVSLAQMPLTPNGKIDRRALPAPDAPSGEALYVAPQTPQQEILAQIWADILHLPQVGIHDNFFMLGGQSLIAIQLISRIRTTFNVELPVRALFANPTIAQLAPTIEQERANQAGLTAPPLVPQDRPDTIPLSFAQQRLWFLDVLEPESDAYNIPLGFTLTGSLHMPSLIEALNVVVARHESLRTIFKQQNGQPYQHVLPQLTLDIPFIDARDWTETAVTQQANIEAKIPFKLNEGPLLRIHVWQMGDESYLLLLNMHHIISDGWSVEVLMRELMLSYITHLQGKSLTLPQLPIQYPDFAIWQRGWLQGEVLEQQLAYWHHKLGGTLPVLALPTDYPRPTIQTYRGAVHERPLAPALAEGMKALSQQAGTTLFMTWLACFKLLLSRYANQDDILIGTPVANRNRQEVEGLIGFFVNTLVLRTDLSGNPAFRTLLAQVRQTALEAYDHQDVPFEQLVDELQPIRDMSHSPLFQAMFTLVNQAQSQGELPQDETLSLAPIELPNHVAKFDLTLSVDVTDQTTTFAFEYNTDLFSPSTISRMADHFERLLASIIANPAQPINHISLLTEHELAQLNQWNETAVAQTNTHAHLSYPMEQISQQTPQATALIVGETAFSYQTINEQANQLAHYLQAQGIGAETLVAICLERTEQLIISILAVLKTGAAYVPIDPNYPPERIQFMMTDAQTALLITQSDLSTELPSHPEATLYLDQQWETAVAPHPTDNLPATTQPDNLAYLIYTSGSTGTPKGVAITHGNARAMVQWAQTVYPPQTLDGVLASTSVCFDLSIFEIFLTLSSGGTLILAQNILALPTLPAREQVTLINTVPSALSTLLTTTDLPANIRIVNLAGEVLHRSLADQLYAQPAVEAVYNLYGPSEDTTYSTFTLVPPHVQAAPTIGKPIENTQAFVLDSALQRVPVGLIGDLYLSGLDIARGYWQRPSTTADRFIPHPFSDTSGARLYRTGDLARYLPDGNIEFLGRADNQVKLRGFRIELGEIEAILADHDAVVETAVIVHNDQMLAYVVTSAETTELHTHLEAQLPHYMVPNAIIPLEKMPLLPNGKINRKALPQMHVQITEAREFIPARDSVEQKLVEIWQALFEQDAPISITDDFFSLGGHSLLAVRLASQIEQIFGVHLPVAQLFQQRRIDQLATYLRATGGAKQTSFVVPLQPHGEQTPLFIVHAIGGNILSFVQLAEAMGTERPLYGIQAPALSGDDTTFDSLETLATYYIQAMRQVQSTGPYLIAGWSFGGVVAFEMAHQLQQMGEQLQLVAIIDSPAPQEAVVQTNEKLIRIEFIGDLIGLYGDQIMVPQEQLAGKTEEEQISYVLDNIEAFLPPDIDRARFDALYEIYRHHLHLLNAYHPTTNNNDLLLIRATETTQPAKLASRLRNWAKSKQKKHKFWGWDKLSSQPITLRQLTGNHYTVLVEPNVQALAQTLQEHIMKQKD